MFILANFILAAAKVLDWGLETYKWIIIISALLSWVNPDPYNPIVRFLHTVTDPVLKPIRRIIGFKLGPIDISPIIVYVSILFLQWFLVHTMVELAYKLKGGALI